MAFIDQVSNGGPAPALEMTLRFAGQRQRLIASNIANIDTPDYIHRDVDVRAFQRLLGEAIDRRRAGTGGERGELPWRPTRELKRDPWGELRIEPRSTPPGVLFHDRNNRNLERLMQSLAENAGVYRMAAELLRSRHDLIRGAIRETP